MIENIDPEQFAGAGVARAVCDEARYEVTGDTIASDTFTGRRVQMR